MKPRIFSDRCAPTILILQENLEEAGFDSSILTFFNKVFITPQDNINILAWIQQNQPDLILLELGQSQCFSRSLAPLKLDWLTRDIPILIIGNKYPLKSVSNLNCDFYLSTPCSTKKLEEVICSLVQSPACQVLA